MVAQVGTRNSFAIVNFLRDHVFKHEEYFVAYKYGSLRSFCDYSNTPLEGTNGGLKYCNFAVKPNMKISKSTSCMVNQDESKYVEKLRKAHSTFSKTKLYFQGEGTEAKRIVPKAFGELKMQMDQSGSYCSIRLNALNWIVRIAKGYTTDRKLPHFLRFRYVQRCNITGGFCCTCPFSKSYGIVCRHIIHVVKSYSTKPYIFSHHDVDVRWWTTYATLVALEDREELNATECSIADELIRIRSDPLCFGRKASICEFDSQTFKWGIETDDWCKKLQLLEAKDRLFANTQTSRLSNYYQREVEAAISSLNEAYNGVRRSYMLSYDDDDNGNDYDCQVGGSDTGIVVDVDAVDDFAAEVCEVMDESGVVRREIDHYKEMLGVHKQVWDLLENCDDDFYFDIKQEAEERARDLMCRVHTHLAAKSGKTNTSGGALVSCKPTNVKNVSKNHKKQNTKY